MSASECGPLQPVTIDAAWCSAHNRLHFVCARERLTAERDALAAKVAELERAWSFVPDANGGHMLSATGDRWIPEKQLRALQSPELHEQIAERIASMHIALAGDVSKSRIREVIADAFGRKEP